MLKIISLSDPTCGAHPNCPNRPFLIICLIRAVVDSTLRNIAKVTNIASQITITEQPSSI